MGLFDRIKGGKGIPRNATFRITQEGLSKLGGGFSGDDRSKLLFALESNGTCSVEEMARNSGLSRGKVERMIPSLIQGGYIQHTSTAMAGGDD